LFTAKENDATEIVQSKIMLEMQLVSKSNLKFQIKSNDDADRGGLILIGISEAAAFIFKIS
jgi:hypothetical protein